MESKVRTYTRVRYSCLLAIAMLVLIGASLHSPRSTATATKQPESKPSVQRAGANLLEDYLRGDPSSPFAPTATVELFASNCTTAMTDFNLGDTVCIKVTDSSFASGRKFVVADNTFTRQDGPTITMSPQTTPLVLPSTRTSNIAGGAVQDNRGTWTAFDYDTVNNSPVANNSFRVHQPGHPAADLQINGSSSQNTNQLTYHDCVFNSGGPDVPSTTKFQATIPNNTTFVSITPSNPGSWTCGAPSGGTVICNRSSGLPINVNECFDLLVTVNAGTIKFSQLTSRGVVSSDIDDQRLRSNVVVNYINADTATAGITIGADPSGQPAIISESCVVGGQPAAVDPGETVTVNLCALNFGNTNSGSTLVGTLQAVNGVTNPGAPQTYGAIPANQGGAICRNFSFTAAGTACGSVITPVVVFTEGATPRGTGIFTLPTGFSTNGGIAVCCAVPTADSGSISGIIADDHGAPLAGTTVHLEGNATGKVITDARGFYRFDNVSTTGFYTVTPSRPNYTFDPSAKSFSQIGQSTDAMFTGSLNNGNLQNPLDSADYFVRQQYLDFLGREPDESGFNFWSDQILSCGTDAACIERRTINVSAAYFLSIEFQSTGGLVDGLYRASFGRAPQYAEFMPDTHTVAEGVIVGRDNWAQQLEANKQSFVDSWMQRAEFHAAYDQLSNAGFVDTLLAHTGVAFTATERDAWVNGLSSGTQTRAQVLRGIVENERFVAAKQNEMFVMMEYFGYLRRDPDASGYQFWLNKLNEFGGNFEQAEMVKAFLVSGEYRGRFSQ